MIGKERAGAGDTARPMIVNLDGRPDDALSYMLYRRM